MIHLSSQPRGRGVNHLFPPLTLTTCLTSKRHGRALTNKRTP